MWLFFFPLCFSICHLEIIICQCGIIWSRFICWETIKQICQYLMWTMAFSMIGARPHFDSLLMSAMWFGALSFSHHWTQIFHLILPLAYSLACVLTPYAQVWAIQSVSRIERKVMERPSLPFGGIHRPFEHHHECSLSEPATIFSHIQMYSHPCCIQSQ